MNHVKISTGPTGQGSIVIDGADVANSVRGFRLAAGVGELTELELQVVPRKVAEFEGDAFVRLGSEFESFLESLGWTPPRRG